MNYKRGNIEKVFYLDSMFVAAMAISIKLSSVQIKVYFASFLFNNTVISFSSGVL